MKRRAVDPVDLEEEHPGQIAIEVKVLTRRVEALRREKERLSPLARRRPWWAYLLIVGPYLIRVVLYAAALVSLAIIAVRVLMSFGAMGHG